MIRRCFWIFLLATFAVQAFAQDDTVVIRPVEIQDVLVNPGMGITTFQRFNGDAINPKFTWSERGPVTRLPTGVDQAGFSRYLDRLCSLVLEHHRAGARKISLGHY